MIYDQERGTLVFKTGKELKVHGIMGLTIGDKSMPPSVSSFDYFRGHSIQCPGDGGSVEWNDLTVQEAVELGNRMVREWQRFVKFYRKQL